MTKYFRSSQMAALIGYSLSFRKLAKLGVPFQNVAGVFGEGFGEDSLDVLLATLDLHYPKIHAV